MSFLRVLWNYRSTLILVLVPLLLLPLPLVLQSSEASCGYCIIVMATYWIAETIPLAVTAFLPIILFPLMGIMKAADVSVVYLKDTNWLFIGGLIIAVAVEHTCLHKRIALRILLSVGTKPHALMLGFMIPTYFLSMWISNTATTAMMLPIADAIIQELLKDITDDEEDYNECEKGYEGTGFYSNDAVLDHLAEEKKTSTTDEDEEISEEQLYKIDTQGQDKETQNDSECKIEYNDLDKEKRDMAKGLTLSIPYASSIGGIATLTGTGPNLVLAGQYDILFPYADVPISFGTWFIYHLPLSLTVFIFAYIWLMWFYLGLDFKALCCRSEKNGRDRKIRVILKNEYLSLGNIRWDEVTVLVIFSLTALLWFFREPGFMPGWGILFRDDYVSDGTVAMTMAVLLFVLPSKRPLFLSNSYESLDDLKPVPPILSWPTVHRMFPWSIMFLLGGGFALAEGATVSGFSEWLADQLVVLDGLETWVICLIITVIICLFTECTSNVATASLFVPIVAQLAQNLEIHPLYLLLPMTVATSLAFMLPVATPPNAIAFSFGRLQVSDLIKAGWLLNIIGITVVLVYINTYGVYLFGVDEFPEWADVNYTTPAPSLSPLP